MQIGVDEEVMKRSVKVSQNLIDKFKRDVVLELPRIFTKNGITLVTKVALITPPMQKSSSADAIIASDMRNIFVPLKSVPFKELVLSKQWSAVRMYDMKFKWKSTQKMYDNGQWDKLFKIFSRDRDVPLPETPIPINAVPNATHQLHRKARQKKGAAVGRWDGKTRFHVKNYNTVQLLINDAKKHIGSMIGGWVKIVNQLGGIIGGIPREYATRGHGMVTKKWDFGKSFSLEMKNDLGDYNGYLSSTRYSDVVKIVNLVAWSCALDMVKVMEDKGKSLK